MTGCDWAQKVYKAAELVINEDISMKAAMSYMKYKLMKLTCDCESVSPSPSCQITKWA